MKHSEALAIAESKVELLRPHCTKIDIAGSIRRLKLDVKDIEIVCLPQEFKARLYIRNNLFEGGSVTPNFADTIYSLGLPVKGQPNGKYMQIASHEGINLDLFMPDDFDYYRQFAIRTGSAEYAMKVIAAGWRKIGWCGSDKGLRKVSDCVEKKDKNGKSSWRCVNLDAELPPVWESEQEFFAWLGVKWIEPQYRNY
ncbi:MAG: hypothetical protein M9949_14320 [Candidatus Kapabacteria bacterium]|nr:hypothetical protein [Candidatus Kapabacteria bacterium]